MDFYLNMFDVQNHFTVEDDPNAISAIGWQPAMDKVITERCRTGPIGDHLEINSHGLPGMIALMPWVTMRELPSFAERCKRIIRPNGFIEILACSVASLTGKAMMNMLLNSNDERVVALFKKESTEQRERTQMSPIDVLTVVRRAILLGPQTPPEYAAAPAAPAAAHAEAKDAGATGKSRSLVFDAVAPPPAVMAQHSPALAYGSLVLENEPKAFTPRIEHHPKKPKPALWTPPASVTHETLETRNANGPYFCSQFAKLSGCRVRASSYKQMQTGEDSGNEQYNNPIGDWEGHVLDFMPGGEVRYVGFNLPRKVFKTTDPHGEGPMRTV